ncbi:hypothetical protein R3P38DRAFT_2921681 [Favolaschia claudopus]|uniref:GATA-type domain-containing protein n=1 Tax=Favolaschia claudopus TaxID=2862362 RepID=A0AAW0C3P3_9AGAR
MSGILEHCSVLYSFASRYAHIQQSHPHVQPHAAELADMARRANEVVRLLEELRRMEGSPVSAGEGLANGAPVPVQRTAVDGEGGPGPMEVDSGGGGGGSGHQRVPKRPWEEMNGGPAGDDDDGEEEVDELESDHQQPYPTPTDTKGSPPSVKQEGGRSTAEKDMELIRTKRASATGMTVGGVIGQTKNKYRKRSRATPPGKCNSCNIRETPEWRRGPDGARTLCNACGLHYAKLVRKREKEAGTVGGPIPVIDMDTLRASARAEQGEKANRGSKAGAPASTGSVAPRSSGSAKETAIQPTPPTPQSHHEGSFQLTLTPAPTLSPSEVQAQMQAQPPQPPAPPITSWATSQRTFAPEQLQHQSFVRTPQVAK